MSIFVIFQLITKVIALLFGHISHIFITCQSAIKINQFQCWSFFGKIPRLQPYFLAKNRSFSSLFNLQSKSINVNVRHLLSKYQGYSLTVCPQIAHCHHFSICNQSQLMSIFVIFQLITKVIALLFGHISHIFITCQSAIKVNQFQFQSFFGKIPRLQLYFQAKNRSFSSLFNLQSKSINFNFGHFSANYQGYSLTFWPKIAHCHHFSLCNQDQLISSFVIFWQSIKVIALLFAKNRTLSSLFNLQSKSINVNFRHFLANYQGYSLTFWPYIAHFHHLSISTQSQSISILVIFRQNTTVIALLLGQKSHIFITCQSAIKVNQFQFQSCFGKIPRLQLYFQATNRSFSSLFNLQSKSINFNFVHLLAKYQGYSLTFWPKIAHFHHFSLCNQDQVMSSFVIFWQITKVIALLFAKNRSFSSLFNLQSKSINFSSGHFSAKYQGYSLTVWPTIAHFHHFSLCNQSQSISSLVIFRQDTKIIALLFGQKSLIFITFQSAIKVNQFQYSSFFRKIPRLQPYFLAKNRSISSLFNLQSQSNNFNFGHLSAKYQGYSLTFWPTIAHCHHFSLCNKDQLISSFVIFWHITKVIALLFAKNRTLSSLFNLQSKSINVNFRHFLAIYQGYSLTFWPYIAHFHHLSICTQSQSISILVIFRQNTTVIALLLGQKSHIFITCQSAIKVNQFQFQSCFGKIPRLQLYFQATNRSFSSLFNLQSKSINFNFVHLLAKYQGYSLTFWPKIAHFHHFSLCNQDQVMSSFVIFWQITKVIALLFAKNRSFSSLFNLQSKSINFSSGHFSAKYQGYSLTVWPTIAHFHHFSLCNQSQSISSLVIFRQDTKIIALLFGQKSLIFITFQSAIKVNQFQYSSFFRKIPRLQPYFLAKNRSISSLFNLQSQSNNFNFGHLSAKYQGYSLTFWPTIAHCHHFSLCNKDQLISSFVIFWHITKVIALLFAKNRTLSSLFNLESKSINVNFRHFLAIYQGYSLTFWPYIAHFHHLSICNQSQSISILVIFRQNTTVIALLLGQTSLIFITFHSAIKVNQFQVWSFLGKIQRLQPYFLAKNRSFSSLFNLQSKSINFNIGHFSAKYQGYSLTFRPKIAQFHHFSISNHNQSILILVIFRRNTKVIALLFGQQSLIVITSHSAIKIN